MTIGFNGQKKIPHSKLKKKKKTEPNIKKNEDKFFLLLSENYSSSLSRTTYARRKKFQIRF